MTREFSICLLPDQATADKILQLRAEMPTSPYRDDTPHVTLLRGVVSPTDVNDEQLLHTLESFLEPDSNLPANFQVKKIANRSSHLYSSSSLVILQAGKQVKSYRKKVIRTLKQNGYTIPLLDRAIYIPHLTIRLGVPVKDQTRKTAAQLFPHGSDATCGSWMVLRLTAAEPTRLMREISLVDID